MSLATIQAAQRRCARERQVAQDQREREQRDHELSIRPDPAGRSDAQITAALLAYQLPAEDQALLDEVEAHDRREAKAAPIRARAKAKREAKAKRDRVSAKAAKEERAWRKHRSGLSAALAGICLYGKSGRCGGGSARCSRSGRCSRK